MGFGGDTTGDAVSVWIHQHNGPFQECETVAKASEWLIRFFTTHDFDAPHAVRKQAGRPDATPEEVAACRKLSETFVPENYFIEDADGERWRTQRDGAAVALGAEEGGAENDAAQEDVRGDAGADESAVPQRDSGSEVEGG